MSLSVTRRSQIPGARFDPTNQELIRILRRKSHRFITNMNVYEKEPWFLQHVRHFRSVKKEWYYFVSNQKPPGIKKEDSKKTSRTVASFRWKSNSKTTIYENGVTIGYMLSLTFLVKDKALGKEKASGWVMHEFFLDDQEFQEVVLCKILFKPDKEYAHEFAPRLEPIVIGLPQPPREEAAVDKTDLYVAATEKIPYLNVPVETHQGVEQQQLWTGSCPSEVSSYPTGHYQQFMNGGMDPDQGFGCYGQFLGAQQYNQDMVRVTQGMMENQDFGSYAQYWGGDLAQNHLPLTHQGLELQQQDNSYFGHNVSEDIASQQQQQYLRQESNFSETQQGLMEHQEFDSSTHYSGGDLTQYYHSVVPMETQQGIEPQHHDNSCFGHNDFENIAAQQQQQYLRQYSNFSFTQQGVRKHQEFSSSTQYSGGDLTQNHHSVVPMETRQRLELQRHDNSCFGHNHFENIAAQQQQQQQQQYLRRDSNFSVTQQGMMEHKEFGSSTQFLGVDRTQNHHSVVPMETQKGIEGQQQDNSCFDHNVLDKIPAQQQQPYLRQDSNFSETRTGMMEHQDFGSSTQFSGGDLTKNHHSVVPMETQNGIEPQQHETSPFGHNAVENQTTEPPYLTQEQNQPLGELDETADFGNWDPELENMADFWNWAPEFEDMANFGNVDWAKRLGENTPEEEDELKAALGNCNTTASLINYFCQI